MHGARSRQLVRPFRFFHDQLPEIVAHDALNAGGHRQEPDAGQ